MELQRTLPGHTIPAYRPRVGLHSFLTAFPRPGSSHRFPAAVERQELNPHANRTDHDTPDVWRVVGECPVPGFSMTALGVSFRPLGVSYRAYISRRHWSRTY